MSWLDNVDEMWYSSDMVCNCEIIHGHVVCFCNSNDRERRVGDRVETIKGVGVIKEIRDHSALAGGGISYLICLGRDGFGGDSDVFAADEVFDMTTKLTKQDFLDQRESMQEDLMTLLDGADEIIITGACQIVVDRINILITKFEEKVK